ncbi:MAG: hypothetical protein IJX99_10415 [Clostridia bacterium]|nr:hypothetical protein [Clostridia bacterium]
MKNAEQARVYKEVLTVLDAFNIVNFIPKNVIGKMMREQDRDYEYSFDINGPIEEQRISKKAATILSVLYIKYICTDENEKLELKAIYEKNEEIPEYRAYRDEVIQDLKDSENEASSTAVENENLPMKPKTISEKIKQFFRKLFGKA